MKEIAARESPRANKGRGGGRQGRGIGESESLVAGAKRAGNGGRGQKGRVRRSERIRAMNNSPCKEKRGKGKAGEVRGKQGQSGVSRSVKKQTERKGLQTNKRKKKVRQLYKESVPENKDKVEGKRDETQGELCQQQDHQHKEIPKQATKEEGEG